MSFDFLDGYWVVGDHNPTTQVYSTASNAYVANTAAAYLTWLGFDFNVGFLKPIAGASNNGVGLIRLLLDDTSQLQTGQKWRVNGNDMVGLAAAIGNWTITVIDATHIDLQGSTYSSLDPWVSGGVLQGAAIIATEAELWTTISGYSANTDLPLTAYSNSPITVGTGDITVTTQAGKFFPIQGTVLLQDMNTPGNHMVGIVKAYSGTTLIVTVGPNGAAGSGTSNFWAIYFLDNPHTRISLFQMNGLRITGNNFTYTVTKGSVRDSTDTVDLTLAADIVFDLNNTFGTGTGACVKVALGGTISASSGIVTGSGTAFTTDFSVAQPLPSAGSNDLAAQLANLGSPAYTAALSLPLIMAAGASNVQSVYAVVSSTSLYANIVVGAGTAYFRGGTIAVGTTVGCSLTYLILLARKDSDGTVAIVASSVTKTGEPDLPSGYTYYRVIGVISYDPNMQQHILQPLRDDKRVFAATITPTALGQNVVAVDTSTGLITWAGNMVPQLQTGSSIVVTGTTPTGITGGSPYYINLRSPNTMFLYNTTQADAIVGGSTGKVIPSTATTGWSCRYFAFTSVYGKGFMPIAPVGGHPGSTTMELDLNLLYSLNSSSADVRISIDNVTNTTPANRRDWVINGFPTVAPTVISYDRTNSFISVGTALTQGSWGQQSTTPFNVMIDVQG